MPATGSPNTLARQWHILKQLPSRPPGLSATRLQERLEAEGFRVTKRTIERDLQTLSTVFPLCCDEDSTPYGWHFMPHSDLAIPGLSMADAVSLTLVEDLLTPLLPTAITAALRPRFSLARKTLAALSGDNPNARWPDKIRQVLPTLPLRPPAIVDGVLETVQEALLTDRQITVQYRKPGASDTSDLTLSPLGLLQRGPVTYLAATAFNYQDVRLYALHRIVSSHISEETVHSPPHFSLDKYIQKGAAHFGNGKEIRLHASISQELAQILLETPLSEDMKIIKRKTTLYMSATVIDSWQLRWWILSQHANVRVIRPTSLKNTITEQLSSALRNYSC